MASFFKHTKTVTFCFAAALLTAACSGPLWVSTGSFFAKDFIDGENVNLTSRSYAAADYLDQSLKSFIDERDTIKALPLYSPLAEEKGGTVALSTLIPLKVGTRLAQLGYKVDLTQVTDKLNTEYRDPLSPPPKFLLSGSFQHKGKTFGMFHDIDVSLVVTDAKTQKTIASFDYMLPRSRHVHQYAKPETPNTGESKLPEPGDGLKPEQMNN